MNQQKLSQLNAENRAAQVFFAAFAERRRAFPQNSIQDVIDIGRRQNQTIAPAEVEAFFEALEAAECGQTVHDEAGTRFVWVFKATQVSRAALRVASEPRALSEPLAALPQTGANSIETVAHALRLRADWTLNLQLPADFTPAEAERVAHFLRALPLEAVKQ